VDRALGTGTVAGALRNGGCNVEIHDQHFHQAAKDAVVFDRSGSMRVAEFQLAAQKY
jgi:hypothetical protein